MDTSLPTPASPEADALGTLRAEIDRIDDAVHDLLMRRATVVATLAADRVKADGPVLRPGREAMVLRRLLARNAGPLPPAGLVRLWREVFATSTALQGGFAVALHAPGAEHAALAVTHFGVATPMRSHPSPARALAALAGGEATVAVLPWPREGEPADAAWWLGLDSPRLQVVARLPFLAPADVTAEAVVLALGAPDPSGDDRSLLRLELGVDLGRAALLARVGAAGFRAHQAFLRRDGGRIAALVDVDGLVAAGDPRLAALDMQRVLPLGGYAVPIRGGD